MKTIKDLKGNTWTFNMTLRHARVIESELGVNVLAPDDAESSILGLVSNPLKMIDMLWILCKQEVEKAGSNRDEFEDGFDGTAYLAAEKALGEEIVFFTQSVDPTRAKLWTALLRKARKVSEIQVTKLEAFLDSPEMENLVEREISASIETAITTLREGTGKASSNSVASPV